MTPINHYEGDRPNVLPALLPVSAPMLRQVNYTFGICFYNTWNEAECNPETVAIFRIKYKQ